MNSIDDGSIWSDRFIDSIDHLIGCQQDGSKKILRLEGALNSGAIYAFIRQASTPLVIPLTDTNIMAVTSIESIKSSIVYRNCRMALLDWLEIGNVGRCFFRIDRVSRDHLLLQG